VIGATNKWLTWCGSLLGHVAADVLFDIGEPGEKEVLIQIMES